MKTETLDLFLVVGINYSSPNQTTTSKAYFNDVDAAYEFARTFTEWTIYNRATIANRTAFYIEDSNSWENHI